MFRSTLLVGTVGLVATPEAGTMCIEPRVWQTIDAVVPRIRLRAIGQTWFVSFFYTHRFFLATQFLGDAYGR